jgi:O-antigen ligase
MGRRSRRTGSGNDSGAGAPLPEWRGERIGVLGGLREGLLAVLCGVMPWWFGSSDPPAIFVVSALIAALAVLTLASSVTTSRRRGLGVLDCLLCLPVLALGLAGAFGVLQWAPIGPELLGTLSPSRLELWKSWGGGEPVTLLAEPGVTVAAAPARIAWLGVEVYESVVWLGALWVLAVSVLRLPGRWGPLKRHSLVLTLSGTLMAIQSMLQAMTFDGRVLWLRPKGVETGSAGPFFVHSELAAYLNLCLGFALAQVAFLKIERDAQAFDPDFLREKRSVLGQGALSIYAAGIMTIAVLASGSRGGFLSLLMGAGAMGVVALRARSRMKRTQAEAGFDVLRDEGAAGWYALLGLLAVLAIGLTLLADVAAIFERAESIVKAGGSHAASVRLDAWKLAVATWLQAPLWGTGWGSFLWASQPQIVSPSLSFVTHAESDYVQILPEGGLIGAGLAAVGAIGLIWAVIGLMRRTERVPQFLLIAGAVGGLTAVAWGALTENILRTAGVLIPAVVTAAHLARAAALTRREARENQAKEGSRGADFAARAGGLVLGVALTAAALPNVTATRTMNRAWDVMGAVGVQHAGVQFPGWIAPDMTTEKLDQQRIGLGQVEEALPDWGDYHIRRAIAETEMFMRRTQFVLTGEGIAPEEAKRLSRILTLTVSLRDLPENERAETIRSLLADPIVKSHLAPAARSLAEGRHDQPSTAMVHLEMAILHWLYASGPSIESSLRRSLELAGGQVGLLVRTGQAASALGDESAVVEAFGKCLALGMISQEQATAQIQPWMTDRTIDLLTQRSAPEAVAAAELLIPPADKSRRRAAGERAMSRLDTTGADMTAQTTYLRARAHWLMGDEDKAFDLVRTTHALNPKAKEPRVRLVRWLIEAGRTGQALEEARILNFLWPKDPEVEQWVNRAAEADAIGAKRDEPEAPR